MKTIDGEKYISQTEFEKAVTRETEEFVEEFSAKLGDPMMAMLISMTIMTEFGGLGQKLFKGETDANKQTN